MTNLELLEIETNETLPHHLDNTRKSGFTFEAWFKSDEEEEIIVHGTINLDFECIDISFTHAFGVEKQTTIELQKVHVSIINPSFNANEKQSLEQIIENHVENTFHN